MDKIDSIDDNLENAKEKKENNLLKQLFNDLKFKFGLYFDSLVFRNG